MKRSMMIVLTYAVRSLAGTAYGQEAPFDIEKSSPGLMFDGSRITDKENTNGPGVAYGTPYIEPNSGVHYFELQTNGIINASAYVGMVSENVNTNHEHPIITSNGSIGIGFPMPDYGAGFGLFQGIREHIWTEPSGLELPIPPNLGVTIGVLVIYNNDRPSFLFLAEIETGEPVVIPWFGRVSPEHAEPNQKWYPYVFIGAGYNDVFPIEIKYDASNWHFDPYEFFGSQGTGDVSDDQEIKELGGSADPIYPPYSREREIIVNYYYDALGRLIGTQNSNGSSATIDYDAAGNRQSYSSSNVETGN